MNNIIMLLGRLTKDIEVRYTTDNKAIGKGTIAVKRDYKNKSGNYDTDFVNFSMYGGLAENVSKYAHKGDMIAIRGALKTGSYEKDGQTHYTFDVDVEKATFLSRKKEDTKVEQTKAEEPKKESEPFKEFGESLEVEDSDLPF